MGVIPFEYETNIVNVNSLKIGDTVTIRGRNDMAKEYGVSGSSINCKYSFPITMKGLCGNIKLLVYTKTLLGCLVAVLIGRLLNKYLKINNKIVKRK